MSKKTLSLPCRGFALFTVAGAVVVRTVNVTGVFAEMDMICVTEAMTGVAHVLPLARVASETTLAAKRAAYAAALNQFQATEDAERPQHTRPVMTAPPVA